jgi:hypothetical protein
MRGLGIPKDVDPRLRPIYGTFDIAGEQSSSYGDINFVLKDSVKRRTTYTIGDSLGGFDDGAQAGVQAADDLAAWDENARAIARHLDSPPDVLNYLEYVEAQIHGGVSIDDVAQVVLPGWANDPSTSYYDAQRYLALARRLAELGIEVLWR